MISVSFAMTTLNMALDYSSLICTNVLDSEHNHTCLSTVMILNMPYQPTRVAVMSNVVLEAFVS